LAQLWKRHQSFLISREQALTVLLNPHLFPAQLFLSPTKRVRVSRCRLTTIDLGLDQIRVVH
jgi:hypothetical protein